MRQRNVWDYRVIADINQELNKIEITFIEHRKKVYKIINR
jgi:mRNA-degrading endonuclease RelE of RelBE toxin-antitoxin system